VVGRNHYEYGITKEYKTRQWLTGDSGSWRDSKLCGIRFCAGHSGDAAGSSQRPDWVRDNADIVLKALLTVRAVLFWEHISSVKD
jgi:hypothetical protein